MTSVAFLMLLVLSSIAFAADGDDEGALIVPVTRDTFVSNVGEEAVANLGGADRLKLKGIQEMSLLDIDAQPLRGRVIERVSLHLYPLSDDKPMRVTVSSLAAPFVEGRSSRYRAVEGASSFNWRKTADVSWAYPGSDLTAVAFGEGNTIWRFADAFWQIDKTWHKIEVSPRVMAARVADISYGFAVMDDVGSEWSSDSGKFQFHVFPNRFVSSSNNRRNAPYFTVVLGERDVQPPDVVQWVEIAEADQADTPAGEALVSWLTPRDEGPAGVIGFDVECRQPHREWQPVPRYLIPMAGDVNEQVTMHLRDIQLPAGARVDVRVTAVDAAGNRGKPVMQSIHLAPEPNPLPVAKGDIEPFEPGGQLPQIGGTTIAIIDPLDKTDAVTGHPTPRFDDEYRLGNHLWSAARRRIQLHAARNEFVGFQVLLSGAQLRPAVALKFTGHHIPQVKWHALSYVESDWRHPPDGLTPLDDSKDKPPALPNTGPPTPTQQRHAGLLADIYIPHDFPPGEHRGTLTISSGRKRVNILVVLTVWDFTLPDVLSFVPQMNCYGLPGHPGMPSYEAYYRLAHEHRTCLNRLPYNWTGRVVDFYSPKRSGHDYDFATFDAALGPLLDGSLFDDLPRKGMPVDVFYLPLNENWPAPIDKGYTKNYWADRALSDDYRNEFQSGVQAFAKHIRKKGWTRTSFEFYLNNKVYHNRGSGSSSAPWIFDEPVNTQDFWALRWYGIAFHEAVNKALRGGVRNERLVFRADISRPQWQRDILDGVLDINVVGKDFHRYQRMVMDRRRANHEVTYSYGSANTPDESNVQPAAWCIDTWSLGGDGVLPWNTLGSKGSWKKADPYAIIYPSPDGIEGEVFPSLRLKAFRRGQQDTEYLTMLTEALDVPRWQVERFVRRELNLAATTSSTGDDDAGSTSYDKLSPTDLWQLRVRIGAALDKVAPPAKKQWIDRRPPVRHIDKLPHIGLVDPDAPDPHPSIIPR